MKTFPVEIPPDMEDIVRPVFSAAESMCLVVSLFGSLRSFPGSRHWHLKQSGQSGTLEVTWRPDIRQAWVSYHDNRQGNGWVHEAAGELAEAIARELSGRSVSGAGAAEDRVG